MAKQESGECKQQVIEDRESSGDNENRRGTGEFDDEVDELTDRTRELGMQNKESGIE